MKNTLQKYKASQHGVQATCAALRALRVQVKPAVGLSTSALRERWRKYLRPQETLSRLVVEMRSE